MPVLAVRLTDAEIERVKTLAHANKTTVSGWVRWAIATGQPSTKAVAYPKPPRWEAKQVAATRAAAVVAEEANKPKSKATPQRPTENAYAAFRPVPKPGSKR